MRLLRTFRASSSPSSRTFQHRDSPERLDDAGLAVHLDAVANGHDFYLDLRHVLHIRDVAVDHARLESTRGRI